MDAIELMVKEVGGEWCLFTKDGSRKLGCHPTAKEAYAQEAAIQHQMGEAEAAVEPTLTGDERSNAIATLAFAIAVAHARGLADLSYHRVSLSEILISPGSFEVLPNGDVLKSIPLAGLGEEFINGRQKFSITPKLVAEGIANFQEDGANPIPVYIGHDHTSSTPAAAWINDVFQGQDGAPWGKLQFLKDTWDAIQKGLYKYFSLEFYQQGLDRQGKGIGFRFDGGAILNNPFFPIRVDQGRRRGAGLCFALSQFSSEPSAAARRDQGEATMTDEEKKAADEKVRADAEKKRLDEEAAAAARLTGDRVSMGKAQYDQLLGYRAKADQLQTELDVAKQDKAGMEARLTSLERTNRAGRIRSAVTKLQGVFGKVLQLGDFAIDASETECDAWLATHPFGVSTVDGLEKLAKDEEACAHLPGVSMRRELGGGGTESVAQSEMSTKVARDAAVKTSMAHDKRKYSPADLTLMLERTHQTHETFTRKELAADRPEYAKELLAGT